jgi:hypothetical protein
MENKGPELVEVSVLIDGGESAAGLCLRRVSPVIEYYSFSGSTRVYI